MSADSTPSTSKLPRRRNGKEQACEPCRKAKMRCDHTIPICQNCRRRNIADRCIYVDSPQTRPKPQRFGPSLSSSKGLSPVQINAYAQTARLSAVQPEAEGSSLSQEEEMEEEASMFKPSAGFYGPTSFSAVFQDHESDLDPQKDTLHGLTPTLAENEEQVSARTTLGIKLLNLLPNQATCDRLMELYASKGTDKGFHKPTVIYCMASLWSTFGQVLRHPRKSKDLREVAQLFSRNTMSVLRDTDDPDVWLSQLAGRNLRWEMMGIILSNLGFVLLALPEEDQFWSTQSGRRMHRRDFALEMKECADGCVKLSNQMENINILMVSLLFKRTILESQCTGDTSLMLWRAHGDLNNAATGLGIHRDRESNTIPTISTEMRRRTWSIVFSIDKTLSAFTGRPPGLSHRYNLAPLPLDLSDEILLAPQEERLHAIAMLDKDGWSTTGEISAATSTRAVMIHSLVLSEVLEVSLGAESQYSHERLIELKKRNDQAHQYFPRWLRFTNEVPNSNTLQWLRFTLRLRYLHCGLLLEQLLVRRAQADQQHMLDIAREMLELTVYMWIERDRFIERQYDYDWMIMCYGVPSSGVICVELLKQTKQPRSSHSRLPRSEVIQNLSMLVGFLDWVRPTAANRDLCGRMSTLIKRILDRVLDPPPSLDNNEMEVRHSEPAQIEVPLLEGSDFDWFNTVDWTKGPFMDFGPDGFHNYSS